MLKLSVVAAFFIYKQPNVTFFILVVISKTIDIGYYQNGFYTVALVCDGQILDAKTFVKQ